MDRCELCPKNLRSVRWTGVACDAEWKAKTWEMIALLEYDVARNMWVSPMIRCGPYIRAYWCGAILDSAFVDHRKRQGWSGRKKLQVGSKKFRYHEQADRAGMHSFTSKKLKEQSTLMGSPKNPRKPLKRKSQPYTSAKSNICIIKWELCWFCYLFFLRLPQFFWLSY